MSKRHRKTEFKEEFSDKETIEFKEVEEDKKVRKSKKKKVLVLH